MSFIEIITMALSINPHAVVQEVHLEPDAEKFRQPFSMSIRYGQDISKIINVSELVARLPLWPWV